MKVVIEVRRPYSTLVSMEAYYGDEVVCPLRNMSLRALHGVSLRHSEPLVSHSGTATRLDVYELRTGTHFTLLGKKEEGVVLRKVYRVGDSSTPLYTTLHAVDHITFQLKGRIQCLRDVLLEDKASTRQMYRQYAQRRQDLLDDSSF